MVNLFFHLISFQTDGEVPEGSQLPNLNEDNNSDIDPNQQNDEEDDEDDDFDDSNPPLLFVDVNLGGNAQQRIIVYEGDTAPELALRFCQEHELDEETQ